MHLPASGLVHPSSSVLEVKQTSWCVTDFSLAERFMLLKSDFFTQPSERLLNLNKKMTYLEWKVLILPSTGNRVCSRQCPAELRHLLHYLAG